MIVSGAGKAGLRPLGSQHHTVVASENRVPTATKLVLRRGAADFQQVDKNGTVYDSGTITCSVGDPPPSTERVASSTPINLRRWLDDTFLHNRFPMTKRVPTRSRLGAPAIRCEAPWPRGWRAYRRATSPARRSGCA